MKKLYQRGPQKSCFGIQNVDMGFPGSTYRLIFDVLLRCQKIIIFGRLPDGPKSRTNRALERQGQKSAPRVVTKVLTFGIGGRGGASRALSLNNKTTGSIKGDGICHADGRWPGDFLFSKTIGKRPAVAPFVF